MQKEPQPKISKKINRFSDISEFPFKLPYISGPDEIPNEEYHNSEKFSAFLSSTGLKQYKVSPLWFQYSMENKASNIGKAAQIEGNAYHDYLASRANCGDDALFNKSYAIFEEPVNMKTGKPYGLNTGAYTKAEEEAREKNPNKMLITGATLQNTKAMVNHLLYDSKECSKDIRTLLRYGKAERSYFCEYEGAYFKFRTDLSTGNKIVDWKSTALDDLHENSIRQAIFKYGYDISAAFYQFFNKIVTGKWKEFYWVFQQKSPPYDFVVVNSESFTYQFETEIINGKREKIVTDTNIGAKRFHALLNQHIKCVEEGYWPGASIFIPEGDFGVTKGKRIMECEIPLYQKEIVFFE